MEGKEKRRFQWIKTVGVGIAVAVFLRLFFFSTYIVSGYSMEPTLHSGDFVVINKMRTGERLRHGDIVVFHKSEEKDFVKRVVGLPGDEIVFYNDILYLNGERLEEHFLDPHRELHQGEMLTGEFTLEEITGEPTVPEGKVFLLGDNRLESYDSRFFGFVDKRTIVGALDLRYWPIGVFEVY